jgi:putative two-component system response regulator
LKHGRLTDEEMAIMKTHTIIGADILGEGVSEIVAMGKTIALTHHERWDGTGYPSGLSGKQIPIEGRIVIVADVFDALTSKRPYKQPWSYQDAANYIREQRGKFFDPEIVDIFMVHLDEIINIKLTYKG